MEQISNIRLRFFVELPDLSKWTVEEIVAWQPPEPDPYALLAYPLHTEEWRRAFLHDYYWVGESALFIAVARVWSGLAPPRAARCTMMGAMSGTGGTGKAGLVLTLSKFLEEMLAIDHPFPDAVRFPTLAAWHVGAMAAYAADDADRAALVARYSAILDGRPPSPEVRKPLKAPESLLIAGPWLQSEARPEVQQ